MSVSLTNIERTLRIICFQLNEHLEANDQLKFQTYLNVNFPRKYFWLNRKKDNEKSQIINKEKILKRQLKTKPLLRKIPNLLLNKEHSDPFTKTQERQTEQLIDEKNTISQTKAGNPQRAKMEVANENLQMANTSKMKTQEIQIKAT